MFLGNGEYFDTGVRRQGFQSLGQRDRPGRRVVPVEAERGYCIVSGQQFQDVVGADRGPVVGRIGEPVGQKKQALFGHWPDRAPEELEGCILKLSHTTRTD